jgi:hypothetical protein
MTHLPNPESAPIPRSLACQASDLSCVFPSEQLHGFKVEANVVE